MNINLDFIKNILMTLLDEVRKIIQGGIADEDPVLPASRDPWEAMMWHQAGPNREPPLIGNPPFNPAEKLN